MTLSVDVAVIGAGLGGLSAAVALAKAGRKVLVLEHHAVPGGYAHEFRRGRFRFDISLHAMDGVAPNGLCYDSFQHLGILDRLEFTRLDPFMVARFPGREVVFHADPEQLQQELIRHFPSEEAGIRSAVREISQIQQESLMSQKDQLRGPLTLTEFCSRYPTLKQILRESAKEFWDRYLSDPELKAVISVLWQYFGLPPARLNATPFLVSWANYHQVGAYYPKGGSFEVSRALEGALKEHGGEIRYRQTVSRIGLRDGRVACLMTEQGLEVQAKAIVSNASLSDTLLNMVGPEHLPPRFAERVRRKPPSVSSFGVYLGLQNLPESVRRMPHEISLSPDYDLEGQYEAIRSGDWERVPIMVTSYHDMAPEMAPAGGTVMRLFTLAPWDYENVWATGGDLTGYQNNPDYIALKDRVAQTLIRRVEEHIPSLRESIRVMEVSTPLTNVRYTRNHHGAIYGFEQSVGGFLDRVYLAPVTGLYFAGAWCNGGGQSTALLSGRNVSRLVLDYLAEHESACAL